MIPFDILLGVVWSLLALFQLGMYNLTYYYRSIFHINLIFAGFATIIGIFVGVFAFSKWAEGTLRIIEKKGVYSVTLGYLLTIIGLAVIGIGLVIWAVSTLPLQTVAIAVDFIYPFPAAAFLTRALVYWRWERKNKRLIYCSSGFFLGKIYAYPYIDDSTFTSGNAAAPSLGT